MLTKCLMLFCCSRGETYTRDEKRLKKKGKNEWQKVKMGWFGKKRGMSFVAFCLFLLFFLHLSDCGLLVFLIVQRSNITFFPVLVSHLECFLKSADQSRNIWKLFFFLCSCPDKWTKKKLIWTKSFAPQWNSVCFASTVSMKESYFTGSEWWHHASVLSLHCIVLICSCGAGHCIIYGRRWCYYKCVKKCCFLWFSWLREMLADNGQMWSVCTYWSQLRNSPVLCVQLLFIFCCRHSVCRVLFFCGWTTKAEPDRL